MSTFDILAYLFIGSMWGITASIALVMSLYFLVFTFKTVTDHSYSAGERLLLPLVLLLATSWCGFVTYSAGLRSIVILGALN